MLFDEKFNKLQSLECAPVRSSHGYTNGLYHANYCWERIGNVSNAQILDSHVEGALTDFPLRYHKLFPYGSYETKFNLSVPDSLV